jgi:hypothetical protein
MLRSRSHAARSRIILVEPEPSCNVAPAPTALALNVMFNMDCFFYAYLQQFSLRRIRRKKMLNLMLNIFLNFGLLYSRVGAAAGAGATSKFSPRGGAA